MSIDRSELVKESFEKKALEFKAPKARPSEYFGELVFDRAKMHKYLDPDTLDALLKCIDKGEALDRKTADGVAEGIKTWALEHGVTHVTHWFQPLTEGTAEKHDSLIDYDGHGGVIESFDGKMLAQQEPDASSFPSGGIRATFEARGYTAWDPTSPVFIQGDTLCIPTVFISYTGEALDYKTPLKKALKAVSDAATSVCKLFDPAVTKVYSYLGWEQEYFLVDESLYSARPDLMITGRTLMGHNSSKNQQLDDHYFAAIPARVAAFMRELEMEGHRLGIPIKTRHNEVAPNQFELAPIYGETNLANDQNQLVMNLMKIIAREHGFVVLLHEKPFDGVNGSGKHNNWSLGTDTGRRLLAPGKDPSGNLLFVTFFVNVLAAVQKHNAVLKASIASATNAHRLGANEAPPAIVSAFLGRTMTDVLHKLLELPSDTPIEIAGKKGQKVGLVEIPEIFVDNTDRNRTSPFAFTGNRFEFRAVGSAANCAGAMTTLNAAVAEQLTIFKAALDKELAAGKALNVAVMDTLKPIIASVLDVVCFDGNGCVEGGHRAGAVGTGTYCTELETVAGEGERRGTVAVGVVHEDFRYFHQPHTLPFLAGDFNRGVGRNFQQFVQDVGHRAAEESGNDGGRRFVGAQTMGIRRAGDGSFQQTVVLLDSSEHVHEEGDELQVALGILAGRQQLGALVSTERPVVVLAGTVHAVKRLFVEKDHKTVLAGDEVHQVHHDLVLVVGEVGLTVDGREFELVRSHLVVTGLDGNTQPMAGDLQVTHESGHARRNGGEIMVVELLVLGGIVAEQGASGDHQVRAGGVEAFVHKEILLFPAQVGIDLGHPGIEELADGDGRVAHGLEGLLERGLVVQGLAGIGNKDSRNAKGIFQDEDRGSRIPCRVAAGFEGGADAAAREGRGVRLLLGEHLAVESLDDAALAVIVNE